MEPINDDDIVVAEVDKPEKKGGQGEMAQILDHLKVMVNYLKQQEKDNGVAEEWKAIAIVIDRLFFWVTLIMSIILLPLFLGRSDPHHEDTVVVE